MSRILRIDGTFPQGDDKKGPSASELVDTVISVSYKDDAFYEPHKAYKSLALLLFWGSICKYKNYLCSIASLKTIILVPCVEELQTLLTDNPSCSSRTMMGLGGSEILGASEKILQVGATGKPGASFITYGSIEAVGWCYTVSTENRGTESRTHSIGAFRSVSRKLGMSWAMLDASLCLTRRV